MVLMATNPISLKPHRGRSWKRARRIEIVCRLESMFIPDADIANHLGITVQALHHIKICPEYQALKIQIQTGVISVYDKDRLATQEAQKEEIEDLIPLALGSIKHILLDRNHKDHAKVALDLMDRNKATSKISRTEHSLDANLNTNKENERAKELLALLESSGSGTINQTLSPDVKAPYISNIGLPAESEVVSDAEVEDELIGEGSINVLDKLSAAVN